VNAFFLNEPLREHYVCDAIINNKRQTKTKTNKKATKKAKKAKYTKKNHKKHTKTQIQNRNRSGQYNT
jgi:hypothetical protein